MESPAGTERFVLPFADGGGLELGSVTRVMGVLNATPDSFSDGGRFPHVDAAVDAAARMVDEGADLVDVGGESTRPGAAAVDVEAEIHRVVPLIAAIRRRVGVRLSVDTRRAAVARRALEAGADLVNDVSGFADPGMLPLLAATRAPAIVMHMRGSPATMQIDTRYTDLVAEVVAYLAERLERAAAGGVPGDRIVIDPGIGFGKSAEGNLRILRELAALRRLGRPILVGASRKSFIGAVLGLPVTDRLEGSLAVAAVAAWQGAQMIRVHDVRATRRVVRMVDAIRHG
jgi:dihydropteroate synthase